MGGFATESASWLVLAPFEAPIAAWNGDHRVSALRPLTRAEVGRA